MFSTTEIRFESYGSGTFLPQTCLGMANISTINLEMCDVSCFAQQLIAVCPRLRQLRVSATYFGLWVCKIGGGPALYSSKWTWDMVRSSCWFQAIRPLSGLEDVLINFEKIPFVVGYIYNVYEQDHFRTNTALVRSVSKQSATRPREASSSGTLPLAARGLLHSASQGSSSTVDANLEFEVRPSLLPLICGLLSKSKLFEKATWIGPLDLQDTLGNRAAVQSTTLGGFRQAGKQRVACATAGLHRNFCYQTDLNESEQAGNVGGNNCLWVYYCYYWRP